MDSYIEGWNYGKERKGKEERREGKRKGREKEGKFSSSLPILKWLALHVNVALN